MKEDTGKLRICDWAEEDRPREKLILKGASSLSNAELLAILIGSGSPKESAVDLSRRILERTENNLQRLSKLSVKELASGFRGIGTAKAVSIAAALELGKRRALSVPPERDTLNSSSRAYRFFRPLLADLPHEELWMALLDRSSRVIGKTKISQGGISETTADIRLILKEAICSLASSVILCHNHPSGNARPSSSDIHLTHRLYTSCVLMNISLADHLILADGNYYSFADEGRLEPK